jgi:hypothetical protein
MHETTRSLPALDECIANKPNKLSIDVTAIRQHPGHGESPVIEAKPIATTNMWMKRANARITQLPFPQQ